MHKPMIRWGILGAAEIARKNWLAIKNSGNGVVAAVASRQVATAARFIDRCQSQAAFGEKPRAVEGYATLLGEQDIDAVYIPLPTGLRKEWVIAAAQAGKHVVCEKPCAVSVADLQEMIAACRKHRVQFMDGVMFMHSRRLALVRQALAEKVGRLRRLTLAFTFRADENYLSNNIRTDSSLEPLGCAGDLAWYCIRFALWALEGKMPRAVSGRILTESKSRRGGRAVPIEFSGELMFDGGVSASFYSSFITYNQQLAQISGDLGFVRLSDFVLPFFGSSVGFETCNSAFEADGCNFNLDGGLRRWDLREYSNSHATAQESNMFRDFAAQIQSGKLNREWPDLALKTQQVLEDCLRAARSVR
ncbi:MAG TPA: Gfo/Idh/MocA family oxidoreductase [Verrucomicrobiae bacterium]|jgi:predicted dehydrogenase|nr:Gfo/Idh/MocA family oxidoreductase [Verrucomicrobiae bacterium]